MQDTGKAHLCHLVTENLKPPIVGTIDILSWQDMDVDWPTVDMNERKCDSDVSSGSPSDGGKQYQGYFGAHVTHC